jgi:hypothetical protein
MKAINDQIKVLQDLAELIRNMEVEIELLRNITLRYYLHYGSQVQNGKISVPENISFSLSGDVDGSVQCKITDHNKVGMESNYNRIKNEIQSLSVGTAESNP